LNGGAFNMATLSQRSGRVLIPTGSDENGDGALFVGGISRSETALAIFTTIDIFEDVES
jgi:hypothetical protein